MDVKSVLEILVLLVGFYMAWNIGANDVSNAMGTSVGSGALTLKKAVFIAAILEFSGAFFVGSNVSHTMQSGLIDTSLFINDPMTLILGMCAALLGTSVWIQIASYFGWPVSTTHAIVGAILGFGAFIGGVDAILWQEVGSIALSWIVSPLISAIISYCIFIFLQKKILFAMNPTQATIRLMPLFVFIVFATFTLSLIFNGLANLHLSITFPQALCIAILIGAAGALITRLIVRRVPVPTGHERSQLLPQSAISLNKAIKHLQRVRATSESVVHEKVRDILKDVTSLSELAKQQTHTIGLSSEYQSVEKMFVYLQIFSASFVAFAHGANDVANAIGPVAAVLEIIKTGSVQATALIPPWLLALGGIGIVIGLATWGWRVIETIGKKLTELTPTRGFSAEFGAATTILIASKLGLPISTTHCLVGAVLGVGLARGIQALNLSMLKDVILSWIVTIPASAGMAILFFYLLRYIFIKGPIL